MKLRRENSKVPIVDSILKARAFHPCHVPHLIRLGDNRVRFAHHFRVVGGHVIGLKNLD